MVDDMFPEQDGSSEVDPTIREDAGVLHLAYRLPYRLHEWKASAIVVFNQAIEWTYGGVSG
jgi:hypothetical protein